ncbi:45610_t:CDS:2 [Gigaspora margarita]|uniref:45610_t:CDS:1 n=1 Tax=Gigaspora margarita TaxID=4874 RepID=A0ABN7UNG9_GIGMA|nr:45610_t:CDS:2 [Gigaspora margarita]
MQIFYFITANLECFYERRLLAISNKYPERMHIMKKFLCSEHEELNIEGIRHRRDGITFDVPSTTVARKMYIVDPTIGTCSCFVNISGSSCKYQAAIALKFQEGTSNFIDTFTINDRINYFLSCNCDVKQNKQLLSAFEKFQKGYYAAKNISENKLVSFVYQHANSPVTIRSGTKIPVQVASV